MFLFDSSDPSVIRVKPFYRGVTFICIPPQISSGRPNIVLCTGDMIRHLFEHDRSLTQPLRPWAVPA